MSSSVVGWQITKELFRTDVSGNRLEDLSESFEGGTIQYRHAPAGGVTLTFAMNLVGRERVTPLRDCVSPYLTIRFDDGTIIGPKRMGVYVVGQPDASISSKVARLSYPCEDLTAILRDAVFTGVYKIPSGTNFKTAIEGILTNAGLTNYQLPNTTRTLGKKRDFPIGTTNLEAVTNITDAGQWWPIWMDLNGRLVSQPSRLLSQSQAVATYTNDQYIGEVTHKPTRGMVGNVVVVRSERSDKATLYAKRYNTDVDSPVSLPNLGREILYGGAPYDANDAETQDDVDAIADRMIEEARSYERTVTLTVPPYLNDLGQHRVVELDIETQDWDFIGRHWVTAWSVGTTPADAVIRYTLNRLVRQGLGEDLG